MRRSRTRIAAGLAIVAVVVLGGQSCENPVTQDRAVGTGPLPDNYSDTTDVTLWRNANGIPNVAIFCAGGLRFAATLSQDGAKQPSLVRVPEQDRKCQS